MFPVQCASHGRLILLSHRRIRLENTAGGILVHYHCICGHRGVERTGVLAEAGTETETEVSAREPVEAERRAS